MPLLPANLPPIAPGYWLKVITPAADPSPPHQRGIADRFKDTVDPGIWARTQLLNNFAHELEPALRIYPPIPTRTGINGSFFLCDTRGQRAAIFKPMGMEAGGPKNHRLPPTRNVQSRSSISPGQGAGNEVLASAINQYAFSSRYGIPKTILIRLSHPAFEGEELGSAQVYIPHARPLSDMSEVERAQIPQVEWEKLNFRLISGSTDAHLGNILYCAANQRLHLIDSGCDFVGESGESQYYNPWAAEPRCNQPMSAQESYFLANIDPKKTMKVFEEQALLNERMHPKLHVSIDKYLTQVLRLELAIVAGRFQLTQREWASLMSPPRSTLERIYDEHIRPHAQKYIYWKDVTKVLNWPAITNALERAATGARARLA